MPYDSERVEVVLVRKTMTQSIRTKEERQLRMRLRLFRADPHCFWCGIETVLEGQKLRNLATVDHLYSRWHPERKERHVRGDGVLHVLACQDCNQERAGAECQMQPFIPKLSHRLEFARLADATLANQHRQPVEAKRSIKPSVVVEVAKGLNPPERHPAQALTLGEEYEQEVLKYKRRRTCTLKEAVEFAREHPAR